ESARQALAPEIGAGRALRGLVSVDGAWIERPLVLLSHLLRALPDGIFNCAAQPLQILYRDPPITAEGLADALVQCRFQRRLRVCRRPCPPFNAVHVNLGARLPGWLRRRRRRAARARHCLPRIPARRRDRAAGTRASFPRAPDDRAVRRCCRPRLLPPPNTDMHQEGYCRSSTNR